MRQAGRIVARETWFSGHNRPVARRQTTPERGATVGTGLEEKEGVHCVGPRAASPRAGRKA